MTYTSSGNTVLADRLDEELFSDVDARCILDFTKESGFYRII